MLWWLLVLLIPILVHLFNFRKYKKVLFSNIQFLKKVQLQTQKTKKLKKYLLLGTRISILSCIVLAFSLPYCGKKNTLEDERVTDLFYIDNSPSMEKGFESLKNTMRLLVSQKKEGVPILLATPFNDVQRFLDKKGALEFIDNLELNSWTAKLSDLKALQNSMQREVGEQLRTTIIGDFDSTFFDIEPSILANSKLILVSNQMSNNIFIDSAYLKNEQGLAGSNGSLLVELGANEKIDKDLTLSLYAEDQLRSSASFNFKDIKDAKVSLDVNLADLKNAYLQIEDEYLSFDNTLYLNYGQQKKRINVLMVGADNKYLNSVFATDPIYEVVKNQSVKKNLEKFDLVIVNGFVSSASQNLALKSFVEEGGNILLIPSAGGNQVDFSFLGCSQWSVLNKENQQISGIDFNHPLYKNVYSKIPRNPIEPSLKQFYQLGTSGNSSVILKSDDKQPILIQKNIKAGQVYQFAIPISEEWSELPLVGYLFYPTISNMALAGKRTKPLFGWLNPSFNPISIANVKSRGAEQYELKKQDKVYTIELIQRLSETYIIPNKQINVAGYYQLVETPGKLLNNIALNQSRQDSRINTLSKDELKEKLANIKVEVLEADLDNLQMNLAEKSGFGQIWKRFILFALLFILIEIFLLRLL